MSWRPVKSIVHAVCIHHFEAVDPDDLALEIGDDVYITEIGGPTQDWCRGWLIAQPSILNGLGLDRGQPLKPRAYSGNFPRTHVEVREVLGNEGANFPASSRLVNRGVSHTNNHNGSGPPSDDSDDARSTTVSRARSIRRTRLTHRRTSNVQLEPVDVMPRRADAPKEKAPLPALRIGDDTDFSLEEPLVDEISACIREWYSTRLHDLVLGHEYELLDKVSGLVTRLDDARRQLIHDLLTEKELSALRENTIWELVDGNKMMDGGVIVRDPRRKGRILTAHDNIPDMLRLQAMMSLRNRPPPAPSQESPIAHLLVDVKDFPAMVGDGAMLHLYLCRQVDAGRPCPVSEVFAVEVPIQAHGQGMAVTAAQLPRTLFTDLTKTETGSATDPSTRLYLVCLLQREEPLLADIRRNTATPTQSYRQDRSDPSSHPDSANSSRRSFLFGSQRLRRPSQDQSRPVTAESTRSKQNQSAHTPNSIESQPQPAPVEKRARRVVGYSAIEVGALVRSQESSEMSLALWAPASISDDKSEEPRSDEKGWEDVIKHLARSPTGQFTRLDLVGSFSLSLNAFAHTDVQTLIKDHPALLHNTHCTQALGYVPTSQQPRSDIYLTLREPQLPPGARCFHPQHSSVPVAAETGLRNLQLTLEVRTEAGRRIEGALCPTSNRSSHTAFRTPAIDRGEAWNQTIRLSVPTDDLPASHVVLSIADGSNFPFALAWLPLWNPTTNSCPQGDQVLAFWEYSEYTASTLHGRGAYQSLPSRVDEISIQDNTVMASLVTSVTVTNSFDAQDHIIATLLNWDGNTVDGMMEVLEGFKLSPDTEVVKFFTPILAVLDRIFDNFYGLTDEQGSMLGEALAEQALSCLVHLFHLTHDRRFTNTKDALEEYIINREPSQNSLRAVSRAFRSFISRPYETEEARELRSALKVSGLIVRFITNNHENAPRQTTPAVANPMIPVQNAVLNLMRNPRKELYPTQVMLMQNLASWLPELAPVSVPDEILDFVEEMMAVSATKKDSLRISRLVLLRDLSSLEMFKTKEMRPKVLFKTREWLDSYWSTSEVVSDHQIDGIRMCCSIIESQHDKSLHYVVRLIEAYHLLQSQLRGRTSAGSSPMLKESGRKVFSLPFPHTYPFHTMDVEAAVPQVVLVEIATLLTSIFQKGPPVGDIREHGMGPDNDDVLEMFVTRALQVLRSIQRGDAFPSQWLSLYTSHAKSAVTILQWLFSVMSANFLPADDAAGISDIMSFNNELWELWFTTLIDLSLNKTVSMENFSEQTSRAIWTVGGDVRENAALLLRRSWESLGWRAEVEYERAIYPMKRMGGFQVGLTSKLIPLVVRLCMGLHSGLRSIGLDMLRSMIISEWQLNDNLDLVQGAFFDTFDLIAQQDGPLGKVFTSAFLHDIRGYFKVLENTTEAALYAAVVKMITEVERLLTVLGELTTVRDPGTQLIQLSYLTDFLRMSGKDDAYIRRTHELSNILALSRNYSSAACAIQMHINLLDQDETDERGLRVLQRLVLPGLELPEESAYARKSRLYRMAMKYYEKSHCWENVLDVLKQLAEGRRAAWDVLGLAEVSEKKGEVYRLLAKGVKSSPRYFFVAFSNHGSFPPLLSGKQYIFEGPADCDRRSFCQALYTLFPFVVNLSPEYSHPNSQSGEPAVKILPVTPYKDHLHPVSQQTGVPPQYREHCLTAKPKMFAITERQNVPQVNVTEQVVEKTIYTTREAFPTLLSYSGIISQKRVTLSPLQAAIDRTHRKTQILSVATERLTTRGESELSDLLDTVKASVSPGEGGSVAEYHKLLMVPPGSSDGGDTMNGTSQSPVSTSAFMGETISEDSLLRKALAVALEDHARCIETALASPLIGRSIKSQLRVFFQATFTLELHTMYPSGDWHRKSPAWIDAVRESAVTPKEPQNGTVITSEAEQTSPQRKRSTGGRRSSLRKRLSFLSIGGKSIV